ncbi:MAG: acetyl-CoA carboxylase biotin carboxylase subunit [Alphaproteobacteria bacterium]
MFKKILIANRGEIACRVIRTARRMGIRTVAVYSEADAAALHVEMADEAVCIGPPPAAQSYLSIEKILEACRDTGAEAVHPGYGFLSERAAFVDALAKAGIVFIGPNAKAIASMGDKIESKKIALAAKVATVPGYVGEIRDAAHAAQIAKEIGYPVMVKASAGGGGKGLRIVTAEKELAQAVRSSQNEARAAFGDDRLFIEKFVSEPRHIEVQVMGDKHGNVTHLNERECSIQRRHQKVIEEAPSPFVDSKMRAAMGAQAVALARAVGYDNAGTVEFIVDKDRNFYFLEMNTRLQVEHPVTELTTGVDLVELMIRSAAGERLPIKQPDVAISGWAIESRIYAEDPFRNFLPSIGRLVRYRPPVEGSHDGATIRNDTGVTEGGEISVYYDPLIAKLCTHAPTRDAAISTMGSALDAFVVEGVENNILFLGAIMRHRRFREGRISTGFIAEEYPDGFYGRPLEKGEEQRFALAALGVRLTLAARAAGISGQFDGPPKVSPDFVVSLGEVRVEAKTAKLEDGKVHARLAGRAREAGVAWTPGSPVLTLTEGGQAFCFRVKHGAGGLTLEHGGARLACSVRPPGAAALAPLMLRKRTADTSKALRCPMPGLVVSVNVVEGQEVKAGETLAVIEAMKMENVLSAERDAAVKTIRVKKGDSLAVDDVILEFV